MSVNDGGPAFPCTEKTYTDNGIKGSKFVDKTIDHQGMSLRDWFAGQAAHAIFFKTTQVVSEEEFKSRMGGAAKLAYEFADAMLAERAKRDNHCKGDDT